MTEPVWNPVAQQYDRPNLIRVAAPVESVSGRTLMCKCPDCPWYVVTVVPARCTDGLPHVCTNIPGHPGWWHRIGDVAVEMP